ncbi:MAG: ABC transporter permease [bacterium]|nr:ABC transporter permease [bacterium]
MIVEILKLAFKSIFVNRLRAFLTMLGVIIGVASVVSLSAIGSGVTAYIEEQFDSLGANTIYLVPGGSDADAEQAEAFTAMLGSSTSMTLAPDDLRVVSRLKEYVKSVTPFVDLFTTLTYRSNKKQAAVFGTSDNLLESLNLKVEKGDFFDSGAVTKKDHVIFLGHNIAEDLFDQIDPIGKKVKLGEKTFTVIGVAQEYGSGAASAPYDDWSYIPYTVAFDLNNNTEISEIIIKAQSTEKISATKRAIEKALVERGRLKANEFTVMDQQSILDTINDILGVLTIGLSGIAAISLVVGGIGIMNIMLVSVSERTKEIGLRKALGATPKLILLQFLFEALFLSVAGGLIGLILAQILVVLLNNFFPALITIQAVLLALGVSLSVGLIFGVAPARAAAKLSPIEALRYE